MGGVRPGEFAMVLGGGPIGTLVALVARHAGAHVVVSEINPFRRELIASLGLEVVDPLATDLVKYVNGETGDAGADVVFEVSGAAPAALQMADLLRTRGRVVMVAVYAKPVPVNLHRFFWRELQLIGARVYEREDFAQAIALLDARTIPFEKLITGVYPLDDLSRGFEEMERGGAVMKILIDCAS
jgi:2-desacetyl-2-hydroxyethyl bacteriochlorophyllide A dehydrogenase